MTNSESSLAEWLRTNSFFFSLHERNWHFILCPCYCEFGFLFVFFPARKIPHANTGARNDFVRRVCLAPRASPLSCRGRGDRPAAPSAYCSNLRHWQPPRIALLLHRIHGRRQ